MNRFTFKLMTAVAGLGLVTGSAVAQERERGERREGDRRDRAGRESDRERPRGERSRSGERSERGERDARGDRSRRPQAGGFGGGGKSGGFSGRSSGGPGGFMRMFPIMIALDADGNGEISAEEIKAAPTALKKLDKNKDGKLTEDELRPSFPRSGGSRGGAVGRGNALPSRPSFEGDDRPQSPRDGAERRERGGRGERGGERRRGPSRPRE